MKKYEKIYDDLFNGKGYKNKEYTELLRRISKIVPLYYGNIEASNLFMHKLLSFLDHNDIDFNLIDDNFLLITSPHNINYSYFIDLLKTIFTPIDNNYFGTFMEVFSGFIYRDLMNEKNKEYINNLSYQKIKDLYHNYKEYRDIISKDFIFQVDYDLPIMLFAYFYGNNKDLNNVNKILSFYLDNRDYYYDKLILNGLFFPYNDDDTIPKFFLKGYFDIYMEFIPLLVNDYNRLETNKKRIK